MPQHSDINSDFSSEGEFRASAASVLDELIEQIDEIEVGEIDARLTTGNLAVTFEDTGEVFILSRQTPTHELWLSANLTAWHFRRQGGVWLERGSGEQMTAVFARLFSEKLGAEIHFHI